MSRTEVAPPWPTREDQVMAKSVQALVERSVLRWARESIGLVPVAAARKIGVPDDRVAAWESGEATPTVAQLRKAAEAYKRPLAVFFLPEPPEGFDVMRDFRLLADTEGSAWSPELHAEYRRALDQRDSTLDLAELDESPIPSDWKIDLGRENDPEQIASQIRERLLLVSPLEYPRGSATKYDHLNFWTAALEQAGVLVLATSGGQVRVNEMRAFSLYFDSVPVIMVNGSDSVRGRLYSLLHEYAHLVLHTGGLCDVVTDANTYSVDRSLEAKCNAVAAAALLPRDRTLTVAESIQKQPGFEGWTYPSLRDAAAPFGVSAEAFLRRLLTLGVVSRTFYQSRREDFLSSYEREESHLPSGGNWYRNRARDLGKGFVRRIADARRRRVIDSYTAATFLNVKVDQIERLDEMARLSELA